MQSSCQNLSQQKQQHDNISTDQYYEIDQSETNISNSVQNTTLDNTSPYHSLTTASHLHQIDLCTVPGIINQQHQLQNTIHGTIVGDPAAGHLHYHIYPSRRTVSYGENGSHGQTGIGYRTHGRLVEQFDQHDFNQHYQSQRRTPVRQLRPPSSTLSLDGFSKQKERTTSPNNDNFGRYIHIALETDEKNKNNSLMDLNSDSQVVISGSNSKCQCHTIRQQMQHQLLHQKHDPCPRDTDSIEEDIMTPGHLRQQPPALPPRPPPRSLSRLYESSSGTSNDQRHVSIQGGGGCCKKYVVLCCLCGGLSAVIGSLFLAVHAILSAHTASLALFETIPSYIPGAMLIFMGLFTILLARRKHRYGFLMKACGSVSIVCALVCVLITVTTTVVHMSRLQGLRECVYTERAKSCTCYGAPQSRISDPGVLFEGTADCEAVHGALYVCLRALFGISVAGILTCIFSCMLVYQLVSHEKKKMYWEQLELRCRSLYGQSSGGALVTARAPGVCACCNDCGGIGPWWALSPGNLYTPNPDLTPTRRWRLPWLRSRGAAPSADANYGFHSQADIENLGNIGSRHQADSLVDPNNIVPYSILRPQSNSAYSMLQATGHADSYAQNSRTGPFSVLETPVPLWGPPPPYSDPNSPARRPMLAFPATDSRTRFTKRVDNYAIRETEYRSPDIKHINSNYENTEQVSNDTDTETDGNNEERVIRANKRKRLLAGVENAAFQQHEVNAIPKQSESELYFGDVSSCCGPESSLYDVATENEDKNVNNQSEIATNNYLSHYPKRPSSKRERHKLDIQVTDLPFNTSCSSNEDELVTSHNVSYLANKPNIQYELTRQQCYGYESQSAVTSIDSKNQQKSEENTTEAIGDSEDGAYGTYVESGEKLNKNTELKEYNFEEDVRPINV